MSDIVLPITPLDIFPPAVETPADLIGVNAALKAVEDPSFKVESSFQKQFDLKGKVAFVTGGNSGIGLEYVLILAELGAVVYALDIESTKSPRFLACETFVKRLDNGSSLSYMQTDVRDPENIGAAIRKIVDKHGEIHVAVANAGVAGTLQDCHIYPPDTFRDVIDVNVSGVFHTIQAASLHMLEHKTKGSIIITASMSGSIINRDMHWLAYTTSKGAVLQLSRAFACELGMSNIRVNTISPGHVNTGVSSLGMKIPELVNQWANQNPMHRLGAGYELRGALAYLATDASSYTTGADIQVDGGHTCW